jgi:2-keto-3-deoxy-L-rhamnonate aldolase RhmA
VRALAIARGERIGRAARRGKATICALLVETKAATDNIDAIS